jgi:membrane-bound lytic murein transglycosylase D
MSRFALLLAIACCVLISCATAHPPQGQAVKPIAGPKAPDRTSAQKLAAQMEAASEKAENPDLADDQAAEVAAEMNRLFQAYLAEPAPVQADPKVQGALERMCDLSLQLQLDAFAAPETTPLPEASPTDDLLRITTFLSPEDLKKTYAEVDKAVKQTNLGFEFQTNDAVVTYVNAYQTKLRNWFNNALIRSARYAPKMKAVFKDEGIPSSLVYMAIVESAFNPNAISRAKAVGMWQFMQGTALRYGLAIDFWEDQRKDPEIAARAAARYLKDLYAMFGDWQLALAAYNAGEGKIQRYTDRSPEGDFWKLRKTRYVRRETREYVPAIMAAILLASNPKAYGFEVPPEDPPPPTAAVTIEEPTDLRVLAKCAQIQVEEIQELNPSLKRLMTPPRKFDLRIPASHLEGFQSKLEATPPQERVAVAMHTVKKGETLAKIAAQYNVPVQAIRLANRLPSRSVRVDQTLVIPLGLAASDPSLYAEERQASRRGSRVYKVRKGDTLSSVSRHTGVPVDQLQALNGLSSDVLTPGQRLVLASPSPKPQGKPAPTKSKAGAAASRKERIHHVQEGDNLWDLARKYGTTVDAICRANRISQGRRLHVGDTLIIP